MIDSQYHSFEQNFKNIDYGQVIVTKEADNGDFYDKSGYHVVSNTFGKGHVKIFELFDGIFLSHYKFLADKADFHHAASDSVLEINHCFFGRAGWNMQDDISIYLGAGDVSLHTAYCCAESELNFPLGYYEGVTISIDLEKYIKNIPASFKNTGINQKFIQKIYQKFCVKNVPLVISAENLIDRIIFPLYEIPDEILLRYAKLKVQEILLVIYSIPLPQIKQNQYKSQQTELMREIHTFLINNLEERFTIDDLSKKYHINTSSLKAAFKAVYGMPIASYMKKYRIKKALELLKNTDESIAFIAKKVGYESQSKFTQVFKELMKVLPTKYRNQL